MFYMYALVDGLPSTWRPPVGVVPAVPIDHRHLGSLSLLGSTVDAVPPAKDRKSVV